MARTSGLDDLLRVFARQAKSSKSLRKMQNKMGLDLSRELVFKGSSVQELPRSAFPRIKPNTKVKPKSGPNPKGKGGGTSGVKAKPKPKPKSPSGGAAKKAAGPKIGRIAKTPVARKPVDKYPKGKTIAQTASEQRAAERMGNRYLRMAGSKGSKSGGNKKAVNVKGSVIAPPTKATLRQPKPTTKSLEADPLRRLEGTPKPPRKKPRKGAQPKGTKPSQGTKKSKVGTTKSSSVRPDAKMSVGQSKQEVARRQAVRAEREHSQKIQNSIRSARVETMQNKLNDLRAILRDEKAKPAAKRKAAKQIQEISNQIMRGK